MRSHRPAERGAAARCVVAFVFCLALASPARAASPAEVAAAEATFNEGKRLAAAGDYAAACPKFAESQRLDPGAGTLLNLGDCLEKLGHLASSWGIFREAAMLAHANGDDKRRTEAERRAASLEPRLSKLTVALPGPARLAGIEVKRDGSVVGEGQWGSPVPVDAGVHVISAVAPGYKAWTAEVRVEGSGASGSIEVPVLEKLPGEPVGSTQRTIGFAVLGVGGAGLVLGAITLGVDAAKHTSLEGQCPMGICAAALQGDVSTYHKLGVVSSTSLIAGGVLAATGLVVALTAPKPPARASGLLPIVGPGFVGLYGRFQ